MRSRWSFVAPTPVTYYRARQVLPGHVVIERDIAAADLGDRVGQLRPMRVVTDPYTGGACG